jgi:hypothetical protein
MDQPPRPNPRPLSVERPKPPPPNATDREFAIWCANLAAQCVHNWGAAQSWLEMLSAQIKSLEERVSGHERQTSMHDIEETASRLERVVDRVEGSGQHVPLNSERVREITETVVTKKGYDDLSLAQRERKQFYLSVLLAVIAAGLGVLGGRLLPH